MTILTLDLSQDIYDRLQAESKRLEQPIYKIVQIWLAEHIVPKNSEREEFTQVLRTAGLLSELSPEMKQTARKCNVTLEEVRKSLDRSEGPLLSEIILEQRGSKQ